jgi:hypothetical protein
MLASLRFFMGFSRGRCPVLPPSWPATLHTLVSMELCRDPELNSGETGDDRECAHARRAGAVIPPAARHRPRRLSRCPFSLPQTPSMVAPPAKENHDIVE